jgi:hypothetical protein
MKKIILVFAAVFYFSAPRAQNLVVNSNAEDLPRGTGWTIVSQGTTTCMLAPTSNFLNWTMIPDGSVNYPFDHTTGAAGGTVFYSGCATFFQGPFELRQDIDVTADATAIDAGTMPYTFKGFMQTPVSNQTDQGRFIVDYLNAANNILGVSYASIWQSYYDGSGSDWNAYTDTRVAPVNTRIIRIRLLTKLLLNPPAINVYFDDISLIRSAPLPVKLLSFTGRKEGDNTHLQWKVSEDGYASFEIEESKTGLDFIKIATKSGGKLLYDYNFSPANDGEQTHFYRLKMIDADGKFVYSSTVAIASKKTTLKLSPNPANDFLFINNATQNGWLDIISNTGEKMLSVRTTAGNSRINILSIPAGLYFVRMIDETGTTVQKLLIQH